MSWRRYLLIQGLVVLKQRLEGLQHLHLTGHARRRLRLALHHGHPQGPLVPGHQALQMFQKQLAGSKRGPESWEPVPWGLHTGPTCSPSVHEDMRVRAHTLQATPTHPGVIPFCFQLRDLFLPLQKLLPTHAQLPG